MQIPESAVRVSCRLDVWTSGVLPLAIRRQSPIDDAQCATTPSRASPAWRASSGIRPSIEFVEQREEIQIGLNAQLPEITVARNKNRAPDRGRSGFDFNDRFQSTKCATLPAVTLPVRKCAKRNSVFRSLLPSWKVALKPVRRRYQVPRPMYWRKTAICQNCNHMQINLHVSCKVAIRRLAKLQSCLSFLRSSRGPAGHKKLASDPTATPSVIPDLRETTRDLSADSHCWPSFKTTRLSRRSASRSSPLARSVPRQR